MINVGSHRWPPQGAFAGGAGCRCSQHRGGREQVQALPPLLVGSGLIIAAAVGRRRHRSRLLEALRSSRQVRLTTIGWRMADPGHSDRCLCV